MRLTQQISNLFVAIFVKIINVTIKDYSMKKHRINLLLRDIYGETSPIEQEQIGVLLDTNPSLQTHYNSYKSAKNWLDSCFLRKNASKSTLQKVLNFGKK